MRRRSLVKSIGPFLVVAAVAGCSGDQADPPPPPPAVGEPAPPAGGPPAAPGAGVGTEVVEQGRQVFANAGCAACHGADAQGTPLGPNLTDGTWIWIEAPQVDLQTKLATSIRTGVAQPREYPAPMPPMGGYTSMTEDQLQAVSAYLVSLNP